MGVGFFMVFSFLGIWDARRFSGHDFCDSSDENLLAIDSLAKSGPNYRG
jgi:hypothetical protein